MLRFILLIFFLFSDSSIYAGSMSDHETFLWHLKPKLRENASKGFTHHEQFNINTKLTLYAVFKKEKQNQQENGKPEYWELVIFQKSYDRKIILSERKLFFIFGKLQDINTTYNISLLTTDKRRNVIVNLGTSNSYENTVSVTAKIPAAILALKWETRN